MRRFLSSFAILGMTALMLLGLARLDPFAVISDVLDWMFDAPPKWTQVSDLYSDPHKQEITHGDDPVTSLATLKAYWHSNGPKRRIIFVGNSQMHAISLAPGEQPSTVPEKTYVDLVSDELESEHEDELYRLSFSGMSYPEVFWELNYMLDDSDLRPDVVVLQMNYQSFWAGEVRESMLPMLRRGSFRARMETFAAGSSADAPSYRDALDRHDRVLATASTVHASEDTAGRNADSGVMTALSAQATPGYDLETRTRAQLELVLPEIKREALRESFEDALYRGRLYLMRLKPSTARSISGSRLLAARAAVDSIASICDANHIRLVLFHAPVNPRVSLYRTAADRQSYREFVSRVASKNGLTLLDFENRISPEHWGRLLNGPDPLHMGREAQRQMARQILEGMASAGITN